MQNLARLIFRQLSAVFFYTSNRECAQVEVFSGRSSPLPKSRAQPRDPAFFHHKDTEAQRYSGVVTQDNNHVGLCADCRNMRLIKSDRGSVFYFCQLSATDARFPKYPRLPVSECTGYEKISTAEAPRPGENQSGS